MKKAFCFSWMIVFLLILTSCGSPATPQPTATFTAIPPTATEPPLVFRDDFEGLLADGWQWIQEDPTHWSLNDAPGYLRIVVQPGSINGERIRNLLVREAPQGNFEISTKLLFTPAANFQIAGLLVYQEQGSALQFGRAFSQCPNGCPGNAIYFDSYQGGAFGASNFATKVNLDSIAYLRLRRVGNSYTGFYSEDGNNWIEIGTQESGITPRYVGLVGAQGFEGEAPADFDYFILEELP
jgi:beta-xylosidase